MNDKLLNYYQNYLVNNKKIGKATTRNYIADVRKFVSWYESRFHQPFNAKAVNQQIAKEYITGQKSGSLSPTGTPSASSLKRYSSSLRKFYSFLTQQQVAETNPFEVFQAQNQTASDPWHLREFKNYLFLSNISKVTLKNYFMDIRQFTEWAQKVINGSEMPVEASVLANVDSSMVEEYKKRLLHEANLSPVSINRKLSALRKYFHWANAQQLLKTEVSVASESLEARLTTPPVILPEPTIAALSLQDLQNIEPEDQKIIRKDKTYSRFAPLRLLQKTAAIVSLGLSSLILTPIDKTTDLIRYSYWKLSGRKVFGTIEEVMGTAAPIAAAEAINQLQAANPSVQAVKTAKFFALLVSKLRLQQPAGMKIKGFPKSFYAPLSVSTHNLPFIKKVWYHMRHTRPAWYHRYHTYQIVHHLHFGILLAATSMIGIHVYSTLAYQSRAQTPLVAIQATSPPRTLSFQGKLNDATNSPITAETNLRFAIYKTPTGSGSAQLWQESQTVNPNQEGAFTVLLGKKTILRQDIFTDYPSLYLGISVAGDKELQPRQSLANVTNAGSANSLQGLKPITESNAGTRNVVLALDSSGNLTIGGNASPVFQATGGEFTLSGQILTLKTNSGSNSNIQLVPDGSGIVDIQKPIQNTTNYGSIPSALGAVAIDDLVAILATSSGQSALTINQNSTGPIISASAGGIAKFTVDHQGNGFFGGNLSINGNTLASSANSFTLLSTPINITFGGSASALSLGAGSGTTTINNSLKVQGISSLNGAVNASGLITANGGLTIPTGKSLTLADFKPGSIPFINDSNQLASDSANFYWDNSNKRLGIGTTTPGSKLSVADLGTGAGTALVIDGSGNIFKASSSRRYKDDIKELNTNSLVLLNASPVSFRYKNTGTYDIGYMAEDLDMLGLKDLVIYDKDGKPDAIKYDKMSIYILEIVKQQQAAIKALQETTTTIKAGYVHAQALTVAGYIEAEQITTKSLLNITDNIIIGGKTMKEYIATVVSENAHSKEPETTTTITTPVASSSVATDPPLSQNDLPQASISADLTSPIASSAANVLSNSNLAYTNISTSSALPANAGIASQSALPQPTGQPITQASSSGNLSPLEPKSALFQPGNLLNVKYQGANTDYANIASFSADLAYVPNFKSDYATFNQGLISLGPTSLTDVGVSGKLSVGGNLQISENSIDTIGSDLNLQSLKQGNLSIMGGLIVIDTEGNLTVGGNANFAKDVTIKGKLAAGIIAPVPDQDLLISLPAKDSANGSSLVVRNATGSGVLSINQSGDVISSGEGKFNTLASKTFKIIRGVQADTSLIETVADGSAGTGVITAYEKERTIRTPYVSQESLIYVTATSSTGEVTPYVARQTANSFTIQIPSTVTKDITFNWWIVN